MPVLLAVAPDDELRAALDEVLRRRYGADYAVVVTRDAAEARQRLVALRNEGDIVAVVIAPYRLGEVAAAVGEGSTAAMLVREHLAAG